MKTVHWISVALVISACGVALATHKKPTPQTESRSYCEMHPDEAPNAAHPECYCETDDETLPPGEGC